MTPLFHDAHPSPEHPDRPDHEDFRLIAEVIQDIDAQAEAGVDIPSIVGVDMESVVYTADQRLLRLSARTHWYETMSPMLRIKLISFYLDAFTLGVSFNKRRESDNKAGTAGEGSGS